jgi:hypothetical protein
MEQEAEPRDRFRQVVPARRGPATGNQPAPECRVAENALDCVGQSRRIVGRHEDAGDIVAD